MSIRDFSFQGRVYLGERLANGRPGRMQWVNDASLLNLSVSTTEESRTESHTGNRATSATMRTATAVTFNLTLNHASPHNIALGLFGENRIVAAGSITGEVFPTGLSAGDRVVLDRGRVSDVSIEDSAGSATELAEGTHYRVESAPGGIIEVLDIQSLTQPFVASYQHGASSDITMLTTPPPVRFLMFDGINTVDGNDERVRVLLYRAKFNPVNQFDLINSNLGALAMSGSLLFDDVAASDPALGGFGRIELPGQE